MASSGWFNDVLAASHGQGEKILRALGIEDVAAAMAGRHFHLPGCPKAKARLSDREEGDGGCDCGCGQKWGDWIGLANVIRRPPKMGEAARWIAEAIGHRIPERKRGRPPGAKTNPARSLSSLPKDGTYPPAEELVATWCEAKRGPSLDACRQIDCKVALYRCKVESKDFHGKDKWKSFPVLAIPVYDERGPAAGPVNYRVVRLDGEKLPAFDGNGRPDGDGAKIKTIGGKPKGFSGPVELLRKLCDGTLPPEYQIWWCEGESDLLTLLAAGVPDNVLVLTHNTGAHDAKLTDPLIGLFRGRTVWVIRDADRPGQNGAVATCKRLAPVVSEVRNVTLPYAIEKTHGQDLRDYLTSGGTVADLIERAAAAKPAISESDDRALIEMTNNERKTVDQIILALKNEPNLYVRGGCLVDAIELPHPDGRPDEVTLQIRPKPLHDLRTTITSHAKFYISTEEGPQPRSITQTLTAQVAAAGNYPDIRPLRGVMEHFFLRPDGSVCTENGYDVATQTLLRSDLKVTIPEEPTKRDASEALSRLRDLVCDFPFKADHHRSAWLAGLLTLFARPAIEGPVPFMLIEASMPGSGKTRLVDVATTIANGQSLARNAWPGRDEEVSKLLTAICLASVPVVVFDNCRCTLGGQAIEGIATSAKWKGRVLGKSEETPDMPMRTIFWFTANNAALTLDFARRSCVCRLEPKTDAPDERNDFKHKDLLRHARENQSQLATDVLVVLRAFRISGARPEMPPWGGFEAWSDLIRGVLLWLGQEDPYKGTVDAKRSEVSEDIFPSLIEALSGAGISSDGWTVGEIKAEADRRTETGYGNWAPLHPSLVEALQSAAGEKKLTAQRLGKILHRYDGRIYDGKQLFSEFDSHRKQKRWGIRAVAAGNAGGCGYSVGLSNNGETENKNTESINNFQNDVIRERHGYPRPPALPADAIPRLPALVGRLLNTGCGIFIDASGDLAFDPADGRPSPATTLSADDRLTVADWLLSAPPCPKCGSRRPSAPAGAPGIYCGVCGTRLGERRGDAQHRAPSTVN